MSERKSPNESAAFPNKVGKIKTGNDGNKWIIVRLDNGVQRWKKIAHTQSRRTKRRDSLRKAVRRQSSKKINEKQYKISLSMFFTNTVKRNLHNQIDTELYKKISAESDPSDISIGNYLSQNRRYINFIKYLPLKRCKKSTNPTINKNVITFSVKTKLAKNDLYNELLDANLESIFYASGTAGNELLYPAKSGHEKNTQIYYELGTLDYRKKNKISIVELTN